MRLFLIGALATLALAGCRSTSETAAPVATVAAFDPAEAGYIKKPGKISIHGHAFWRDDEGGTVNAAGEIIRLVPATKYARERFAVLYKGQRSLSIGQIPHVDVDPQYADYTRTARANRPDGSNSRTSRRARISSPRRSAIRRPNRPDVAARRSAACSARRWASVRPAAPCSKR